MLGRISDLIAFTLQDATESQDMDEADAEKGSANTSAGSKSRQKKPSIAMSETPAREGEICSMVS